MNIERFTNKCVVSVFLMCLSFQYTFSYQLNYMVDLLLHSRQMLKIHTKFMAK